MCEMHNVDDLRDYLMDYCGTAGAGCGVAAMAQVQEIEDASEDELARIADDLGIDADQFELGEES